jgi:translation initiation factor 3 subunit G
MIITCRKCKQQGHLTSKCMEKETLEENTTVFISNIPEETTESDMREMCGRFGVIRRISCPKDKNKNSKGFAFVTFESKFDGQKAINTLNGYGYGHLILKVNFATSDTT